MSIIAKIENILEENIRQVLLKHEGRIEIVSYEENVLKVKLLGRCAGCPSANITTEEFVAKIIMEKIPEVKDVFLVQEVNLEILEFARSLLNNQ